MMRTRGWLAMLVAFLPVLPGCADRGGGVGGLTARTDSVGGVARLVYPGEGGLVLPWTADTIVRIGDVLGGEEEYQFDRVPETGLDGDSQGNLYLLDVSGSRVLSYDPEGRHLRSVGRAGEGPGELRSPGGLNVGPGDTAWVLDPVNRRLTGFPPDTSEPRVITFPPSGGFPNARFALATNGFVLQAMQVLTVGARGGAHGASVDSASRPQVPLFRVSLDGTPGDTLWRHTPPEMKTMQLQAGDRVMVMGMTQQFTPQLLWAAFRDGGLVVSETDRYELDVIAPDGRVRFRVVREMAPWPVTDREKEMAREKMRERQAAASSSGGGPAGFDMRSLYEQVLENMTFAETVPRIVEVAVDLQDRIWVGVALTTPGEVERVDLYDRDGRFLGSLDQMKIPDAFLTDNRAAVLVRDPDTDVQQVAIYRIVEGR